MTLFNIASLSFRPTFTEKCVFNVCKQIFFRFKRKEQLFVDVSSRTQRRCDGKNMTDRQ